jgi:hypothetical protein
MLGLEILGSQRIGNRVWVKSLSLILDDEGHSLSQVTAAANQNPLLGVHTVAVNHCIVQGFLERDLNRGFLAGDAMRFFDHAHQLIYQR